VITKESSEGSKSDENKDSPDFGLPGLWNPATSPEAARHKVQSKLKEATKEDSMSQTMPHSAERDPRFIKYLLGELPEPERTKLEDEYLGDDETFKRLVAAEEELIYTYVRGGLSPTQRCSVDRLFLQTPERRSRVVFATAFIACLEATAELSGT
jgi:hypothetical protein